MTPADPANNAHETALFTDEAASKVIREHIASDGPVLIGRLGSVELACVLHYFGVRRDARLIRRLKLYVRRTPRVLWSEVQIAPLTNNAGFFPAKTRHLNRFAELMLDDMQSIDVLGSWLPGEEDVRSYLSRATRVGLPDLEPYYHHDPWSVALTGKRVLVVHPFAQSIEAQYAQRRYLFDDPRVLPDFDLTVLPAIQSIAGAPTGYGSWFEAYRHMCAQMEETEFDVALVGCGAYGLPLAAHAKRLGKKGVHLGGALQILFGIKGKRWDGQDFISGLYNEHWVRPQASERPPNYKDVEDGCYW